MKLVTDYRGEIEYAENDIINFVDPMYGFDEHSEYLLLGNIEPDLPFHWLQAIEGESVTFVVVDPFLFVENYDFELDDLTVEQLSIESIEDVMVYTTVVIPENVEDITINLKSPVIINIKNRKAKQVILDGDYAYKYPIFKKGE